MISKVDAQTDDLDTKTHLYLKPGTYSVPLKNSPEQRFVEDTNKKVFLPEDDGSLQNFCGSDILSRTGSNEPDTNWRCSSSHNSSENNEDFSFPERLKDNKINEPQPLFKRRTSSWEAGKGILTDYTLKTIKKIFTNLERTDFAADVTNNLDSNICTDTEINYPTEMTTIAKKLYENYYMYLSEFVHDIRHIIIYPNPCCKERRYLNDLDLFKNRFDDLLKEEFPNVDFQYVTGQPNESAGLFPLKLNDANEPNENCDEYFDQILTRQ